MRRVPNELTALWLRVKGRPFIAKIAAGVLIVGILSLLTVPNVLDRGKMVAAQLSKPYLLQDTQTEKDSDCSGRIPPSKVTVNLQP